MRGQEEGLVPWVAAQGVRSGALSFEAEEDKVSLPIVEHWTGSTDCLFTEYL